MSAALEFFILDTESNGLRCGFHETTELSIIRCSDRVQFTRQIRAWYPERSSYESLQITGKTIEDLSQGIEKADLVREANEFFNSDSSRPAARCIVAHNYSFDQRFLHELWKTFMTRFPADLWVDSKEMAKRELKKRGVEKPILKLGACLEQFGLKKYANMHSAKVDTRATYNLFTYLMEQKVPYLDLIKHIPHFVPGAPAIDMQDEEDINELLDENGEEIV